MKPPIPFNYQLFQTGKYNLITRNGIPAILQECHDSEIYPFLISINDIIYMCTAKGKFYYEGGSAHVHDIFMVPKQNIPLTTKTKYMVAKAVKCNKHEELIMFVHDYMTNNPNKNIEEAIVYCYDHLVSSNIIEK